MSMSINAEESDANQSKFYKVLSSKPVTNADVLFDTLSKFLSKDKKRQIEMEFLDEKDLISSRLTWNNIRNVANAVIEEGGSRRDPIPAWIEQKEAILVDETPNTYSGNDDADLVKDESSKDESNDDDDDREEGVKTEPNPVSPKNNDETKDDKKAAKKAKKEAKEARKRERAEKREAKKIKREAKEAKRLKKEAKKRRREE